MKDLHYLFPIPPPWETTNGRVSHVLESLKYIFCSCAVYFPGQLLDYFAHPMLTVVTDKIELTAITNLVANVGDIGFHFDGDFTDRNACINAVGPTIEITVSKYSFRRANIVLLNLP